MTQNKKPVDEKRRGFLKGAAAAGVGAVAAAATPATAAVEPQEAEPEQGKGYRLTQHVIDYYKSAAS